MKTIFTNSYFNKTLKSLVAICVVLLMSINSFAQVTATEDFENESTVDETTPHTFSESGISFSSTLRYNTGGSYGFGNSLAYIYLNNTTNGVGRSGTITISNASTSFKINSFASYVGSSTNGFTATNGTITFVGTLVGGSTATATVNVASTGSVPAGQTREGNSMVNGLNFTGTPLDGVFITSLSVQSSATVQFIQLDHINFTTQAVVTNQFSINDVSQNEGNSGTSNFTFTVTRGNNTAASSVQVQSANGTATAGADYTAFPLTTLNFTAGGALTQTVTVTVSGDATVEPNETFTMTLSNATGGVLLDATGIGTIIDDDAINEPFDDETHLTTNFSQSGNNFQTTGKLIVRNSGNFGAGGTSGYAASSEPYVVGNQGSLQITSPGKSFNIISADLWAAAVSGSAPNFVFTATNCTITFTGTKSDGSGTVTHTAAITPINPNGHSTVNFAASPLAGIQLSAISFSTPAGIQYLQIDNFKYGTATLTNTQLSINDVSVVEGTGAGNTTATFTVTRTNNTTAFTVNVASSDGTATAGTDYTAFPSTTLTFTNGGALTQTVSVNIIKDATIEPNETFTMTLSGATNGTVYLKQTGTGTIQNDDSVVETFEDEINLATTFSQNSVNFSASGGYQVRNFNILGSGSSSFFLRTTNTVVGNMGTFSITSPNKAFKLNFLDAWVGTSATAFSSGSVTFTGTLFGGGTVIATKTITATSNTGTGWQQNISFVGTALDNVLLTAIQISTAGSLKVCDIDNFNYTIVNTLPIIEVVDASNVVITNGGVATTANNTDFGGACVTGGIVSKTYTIKNSGQSNLTLSGSTLAVLGGINASEFSITTQPISPISAGSSVILTVAFNPTSSGVKNATITLTNNDGTNSPYVINIKGTGNADPTITVSSSADICAGATSFTIPYTATTGTPTTYSISGTGITTVTNATLPVTPITVNLGSVAVFGTNPSYTLTVRNANTCTSTNVTGNVTITANNMVNLTSTAGTNAQSVCINTPITNITYSTTGATGATFSGLPAGVTGAWASNVVTISGIPTQSGTFNYTIILTGGCGTITATGTITVTNNNTVTLTSTAGTNAQTKCVNTAITNITYSTTGATGATFSGLPTGITGAWASNIVTISGTPTTATGSPLNYTVTLTGGCGTITATGTITVNSTPAPTSPTATPSSRNTTGSSTLSATGCSSPSTITWYDASTNIAVPSPNNQPNFTTSGIYNFYAKCTGTNTCVSLASPNVSVSVALCTPLSSSPGNVSITWTGLISTDWNNPCNWSPAWIPDATNGDIVIGSTTNQPVISSAVTGSNGAIYINAGAILTVSNVGYLTVSNSAASKIILQSGSLVNNGIIKFK